jgi:Skp family chaperone for outer membrane proteins
MNKILFSLLVSTLSFAGTQNASAVRAMNADNTERGRGEMQGKKWLSVRVDEIQKPAPHKKENQKNNIIEDKKAKFKSQGSANNNPKAIPDKENIPLERDQRLEKFNRKTKPSKKEILTPFSESLLNPVIAQPIYVAQPIHYLTRSKGLLPL